MNLTIESKSKRVWLSFITSVKSFKRHSPFKFIHASVLIVMNPSHSVEVANTSHVLGKLFSFGPDKVIDDRNNVAVGIKSLHDFLEK
jgi:hypothetical protein